MPTGSLFGVSGIVRLLLKTVFCFLLKMCGALLALLHACLGTGTTLYFFMN
jgi:hypothetical protein